MYFNLYYELYTTGTQYLFINFNIIQFYFYYYTKSYEIEF